MAPAVDVVVVGGGLIGLASAWRLAAAGYAVTVIDPAPGAGASNAAAGMLAPVSEVGYGEVDLLRLSTESLARYPAFVADVEQASGVTVGLRQEGTLIVGTDAGDRAELLALHDFQRQLGLTATMLTSRECRAEEPLLHPGIRTGLLVASDHSVDNRRLTAALRQALSRADVPVLLRHATELLTADGAVSGVALDDGTTVPAPTVVLAAGAWSGRLLGVPDDARPAVRPVKGQILRLHAGPDLLPRRTVRALVKGHDVYLVPRADGELVLGATVEDMGYDVTVTAGAVRELLRDARDVLPGIDEMTLVETTAALRPGSPDNAPSIGTTALPGLVVATGHHRNGVLLTPVTAELVLAAVVGRAHELAPLVDPRRHHRRHDDPVPA